MKPNRTQTNENNGDQMNPGKIPTTCKITKVSNFRYSEIKSIHRKKNKDESDQILLQKKQTKIKEKLNPKQDKGTFPNNDKHTPKRPELDLPRRKLFEIENKEEIEVVPEGVNWEVLLINSLTINTIKVQTIVEKFIRNKNYISIFCMTETKVDSHDFKPVGLKIFSKHRTKRDKKRRWSNHWV